MDSTISIGRSPVLGRRVTEYEGFDTFESPAATMSVTMTSDEVTAMCPVTGQPDFYTVEITYAPARRCLESKSLKLYLQSWRDRGMFVEAMAATMLDDIRAALEPRNMTVRVTQKARGGISIKATAAYVADRKWGNE